MVGGWDLAMEEGRGRVRSVSTARTYRWLVAGDSGHGRRKRKGQECEYHPHLQVVGGWDLAMEEGRGRVRSVSTTHTYRWLVAGTWPWKKEEEGSGV